MKRICNVLLFAGAAMLANACGGLASDYCDLECDCESCSDNEYDACKLSANSRADAASVYECESEFTRYQECLLEHNTCESVGGDEDRRFGAGPECGDASVELSECISRSSALDDRDNNDL